MGIVKISFYKYLGERGTRSQRLLISSALTVQIEHIREVQVSTVLPPTASYHLLVTLFLTKGVLPGPKSPSLL